MKLGLFPTNSSILLFGQNLPKFSLSLSSRMFSLKDDLGRSRTGTLASASARQNSARFVQDGRWLLQTRRGWPVDSACCEPDRGVCLESGAGTQRWPLWHIPVYTRVCTQASIEAVVGACGGRISICVTSSARTMPHSIHTKARASHPVQKWEKHTRQHQRQRCFQTQLTSKASLPGRSSTPLKYHLFMDNFPDLFSHSGGISVFRFPATLSVLSVNKHCSS